MGIFEKRTLTVNKTLAYRHAQHYWRAGSPQTQQSYRTIPLTDFAYERINRFCMHALRHTYATRAIEADIQPRYCKSCSVTQASKQRWIGMFM